MGEDLLGLTRYAALWIPSDISHIFVQKDKMTFISAYSRNNLLFLLQINNECFPAHLTDNDSSDISRPRSYLSDV